MPRTKGSKNKKNLEVVKPKSVKKVIEVVEEDSSSMSVQFMDSSLAVKNDTTVTVMVNKGNTSFSINADMNNQLFTIMFSPHGAVPADKQKELKDGSFKISLTPSSLQRLLGYMYLTPAAQLDKKLIAIKKDIDKNTRFFHIMDLCSDKEL